MPENLFTETQLGFDLQNIINARENHIILATEAFAVSGFLIRDISLGGNARWGREGGNSKGLDKANEYIAKAAKTANVFLGTEISSMEVRSWIATIANWTSCEPLSLSLDMMFVALSPEDDVRKPVSRLMSLVYPQTVSKIHMVAPLGYVPGKQRLVRDSGLSSGLQTTPGCLSVQIGRWFDAPQIFVGTTVNFQFSKETIKGPDGSFGGGGTVPLYAVGNVSLTSSAIASADEIAGWLGQKLPDPEEVQ